MSLSHIRGKQPSKVGSSRQVKQKLVLPPISALHKNIQKIVNTKKKNTLSSSSTLGINKIMDQKCFNFFMDFCSNQQTSTRIPINTQECNNFLNKHNIVFINERTQELSNAKILITTKTNLRKKSATFVLQLPVDYTDMLVFLLLVKLDFGNMQIEFGPAVGKNIRKFMYKAKQCGLGLYYNFIRLNILNKRFILVRN